MTLQELRQKYPTFEYVSFSMDRRPNRFSVKYLFKCSPDLEFTPEVVFETPPTKIDEIDENSLNNLVFHLGLIEMLSYWKSTASPTILIRAGYLDEQQIQWWHNLLLKGMGEFYYVNEIDFTKPDFVTLKVTSDRPQTSATIHRNRCLPILTPIGGGRDSAITAKILELSQESFNCMMLNPNPASLNVAASVGCHNPIIVTRQIQPQLLELNRLGFLNGHTPFSAYLAFLNALCLALYGYSQILVANERSSEEGNVIYLGRAINHQYSKSYEFERHFDAYLQKYLVADGRYRSFVRKLYELQIGNLFSKLPELYGIPRSCNRMQKTARWCGECAKCLSVYITTYPFVSYEHIVTIFGSDFFENESAIDVVRQLSGIDGHKPFECVGTVGEIRAGLSLCFQKCLEANRTLPPILEEAQHFLAEHLSAEDIPRSIDRAYKALEGLPRKYRTVLEKHESFSIAI
jgi:UDP-N-acetyl-alpha-D-muramoyl-L-alanyl-L-glutamate epimerase